MMSVYPQCMQRPGLAGVSLPALGLSWSTLPQLSTSTAQQQLRQSALTLQVQIPPFPRPIPAVIPPPANPPLQIASSKSDSNNSLLGERATPPLAAIGKPKSPQTAKSTPSSFTIASILSKSDHKSSTSSPNAGLRNSSVSSQALNATGHASMVPTAATAVASPSTPLSGTPKTPLYYIYHHPAAAAAATSGQPTPFSFPAAIAAAAHTDHDLQRSPLSRLAATPTPLTLSDCMAVRRFGETLSPTHPECLQTIYNLPIIMVF